MKTRMGCLTPDCRGVVVMIAVISASSSERLIDAVTVKTYTRQAEYTETIVDDDKYQILLLR